MTLSGNTKKISQRQQHFYICAPQNQSQYNIVTHNINPFFFVFSQESSSIYYQATYGTTGGGPHSTGSSGSSSNSADQQSAEEQQNASRLNSTRLSYRLALQRPTTCPPEIYDLMLECWSLNEHARPTFREITAFLQTRIAQVAANQANQASQAAAVLESSSSVPVYA